MKVFIVESGEFNYASEILCVCSTYEKAKEVVLSHIDEKFIQRSEHEWVYGMDYYSISEFTIDECRSDNDNI